MREIVGRIRGIDRERRVYITSGYNMPGNWSISQTTTGFRTASVTIDDCIPQKQIDKQELLNFLDGKDDVDANI